MLVRQPGDMILNQTMPVQQGSIRTPYYFRYRGIDIVVAVSWASFVGHRIEYVEKLLMPVLGPPG